MDNTPDSLSISAVLYLQDGGFFSGKFYTSTGNYFFLFSYKIDVL